MQLPVLSSVVQHQLRRQHIILPPRLLPRPILLFTLTSAAAFIIIAVIAGVGGGAGPAAPHLPWRCRQPQVPQQLLVLLPQRPVVHVVCRGGGTAGGACRRGGVSG
jgi:hypothetical protein